MDTTQPLGGLPLAVTRRRAGSGGGERRTDWKRDLKAVEVRITGRVQGVNYRGWTRMEAERLGVDGWVGTRRTAPFRHCSSERKTAVAAMMDLSGIRPPAARVAEVSFRPADPAGARAGFRILR